MKKIEKKRYGELHWGDKALDILLITAVLSGVIFVVIDIVFSPSQRFSVFMQTADAVLIGVFLLDMGRTFFRSKGIFDFARHHWVDLVILGVIIVSLSSFVYVGAGRVSWLLREEKIFGGLGKFLQLGFLRRIFRY